MIEVGLQWDWCDRCPYFEAETIHSNAYANGEKVIADNRIVCSNYKICKNFEAYLRKKLKEE